MAPRRARAQHVSEQTKSPCGGTADPARNRAGGARAACARACAARRRSVGRARTSSTLESTHSTSEPSMSMSSAARCGRSLRPLGPARAASARRDGACAANAGVRRAGRAGTHAGANAIACDTHAAIASTRCITAMSGSTSVFPRTRGRTRGEKRTKFYCGKLRSARHWLSSGSLIDGLHGDAPRREALIPRPRPRGARQHGTRRGRLCLFPPRARRCACDGCGEAAAAPAPGAALGVSARARGVRATWHGRSPRARAGGFCRDMQARASGGHAALTRPPRSPPPVQALLAAAFAAAAAQDKWGGEWRARRCRGGEHACARCRCHPCTLGAHAMRVPHVPPLRPDPLPARCARAQACLARRRPRETPMPMALLGGGARRARQQAGGRRTMRVSRASASSRK